MAPTLDQRVDLVKGKHRYLFRYRQGSELAALDAFVTLAADTRTDFDWFDAAVLSYQISKNLHNSEDPAEWNGDCPESHEECWP